MWHGALPWPGSFGRVQRVPCPGVSASLVFLGVASDRCARMRPCCPTCTASPSTTPPTAMDMAVTPVLRTLSATGARSRRPTFGRSRPSPRTPASITRSYAHRRSPPSPTSGLSLRGRLRAGPALPVRPSRFPRWGADTARYRAGAGAGHAARQRGLVPTGGGGHLRGARGVGPVPLHQQQLVLRGSAGPHPHELGLFPERLDASPYAFEAEEEEQAIQRPGDDDFWAGLHRAISSRIPARPVTTSSPATPSTPFAWDWLPVPVSPSGRPYPPTSTPPENPAR